MDLRSYLRNESIASVLYLCKEVESFGSGLKRIYSSCMSAGVEISYENSETSFMIEFTLSVKKLFLTKRVYSYKLKIVYRNKPKKETIYEEY